MSRNTIVTLGFVVLVSLIGLAFYHAKSSKSGEIELEKDTGELEEQKAHLPARTTKTIPTKAAPRVTQDPPTEQIEAAEPPLVESRIIVSVFGRAIDTDKNPVVGAYIELVSVNGPSEKIAHTVSDGDGYFLFDDKSVPPQSKGTTHGTINVFGTAPGYGFAWHGMRSVNLDTRPADRVVRPAVDRSYYKDEECVMNLVFGKAQDLEGVIVDELGDPVRDVSVALGSCDFIDKDGKNNHVNFREFWGISHLPDERRLKTTDSEGVFLFRDLPPECIFTLRLKHPERSAKFAFAVTTERDPAKLGLKPNVSDAANVRIQRSPMHIVMPSTRRLRVLCIHPWSKAPIADARVHAYRRGKDRQSSSGKTNAQGEVDLRLPPGSFKVCIDPPAESELVRTYHQIEIKDAPIEQETSLAIDGAAVVVFEAVDSKTGKGLAGVSFSYQDDRNRIMEVQSSKSIVDHPKTDESGKLRVLMSPGKTRVTVGWTMPKGYRSNRKAQSIDLEGGKVTTIRFKLEPVGG